MPFKGKQLQEGSEHLRMDAQWLTDANESKLRENDGKSLQNAPPPSQDATVEPSVASCIKTGSRVCLRVASSSTDEVVKRENTNSESCWCHRSPELTDRKS